MCFFPFPNTIPSRISSPIRPVIYFQITDDAYEEDMEDDQELLRVEMALAQKELLEYERTVNNKRRRTYIIHN